MLLEFQTEFSGFIYLCFVHVLLVYSVQPLFTAFPTKNLSPFLVLLQVLILGCFIAVIQVLALDLVLALVHALGPVLVLVLIFISCFVSVFSFDSVS